MPVVYGSLNMNFFDMKKLFSITFFKDKICFESCDSKKVSLLLDKEFLKQQRKALENSKEFYKMMMDKTGEVVSFINLNNIDAVVFHSSGNLFIASICRRTTVAFSLKEFCERFELLIDWYKSSGREMPGNIIEEIRTHLTDEQFLLFRIKEEL